MTGKSALRQGAKVYIAVPEKPGHDDERAYPGSEFQTAEACARAFKEYSEVVMGRESQDMQKALDSARAEKCQYMAKPEIRAWEDNPTEWNGERDVMEIDLETFDVETGRPLSRVYLKGRSRWMTFGDKPERMLNGFFDTHVAGLFGAPPPKKK